MSFRKLHSCAESLIDIQKKPTIIRDKLFVQAVGNKCISFQRSKHYKFANIMWLMCTQRLEFSRCVHLNVENWKTFEICEMHSCLKFEFRCKSACNQHVSPAITWGKLLNGTIQMRNHAENGRIDRKPHAEKLLCQNLIIVIKLKFFQFFIYLIWKLIVKMFDLAKQNILIRRNILRR